MEYRTLVKLSGYKIQHIAKEVGVSRVMLSYFLSGKRNLSPEKLHKLNKILNIK